MKNSCICHPVKSPRQRLKTPAWWGNLVSRPLMAATDVQFGCIVIITVIVIIIIIIIINTTFFFILVLYMETNGFIWRWQQKVIGRSLGPKRCSALFSLWRMSWLIQQHNLAAANCSKWSRAADEASRKRAVKREKNLQPVSRHESSPDPSVTRRTDSYQMSSDVYACAGRSAGHMRFVTEELDLMSIKKNKKWNEKDGEEKKKSSTASKINPPVFLL